MFMLRLQKADLAGPALFGLVALCVLLIGGCSEAVTREALPTRMERGDMVTLSIDFQDGFANDTVVLHVNGDEVFRKEDVSTNLLLGKADALETVVKTGQIVIEINIQTRDIAMTIPLEISADTYLGISVVNGRIEYVVSDEPFGYL